MWPYNRVLAEPSAPAEAAGSSRPRLFRILFGASVADPILGARGISLLCVPLRGLRGLRGSVHRDEGCPIPSPAANAAAGVSSSVR
jgi:hypothetical protein